MPLLFVLLWLRAVFAATGDARPLDLAELLIYNSGHAGPPADLFYAAQEPTLFVAFFGTTEQALRLGNHTVRVTQRTEFPKNGDIELRIEPEQRAIFTVAVRIPAWARGEVSWSPHHRFEEPDVPASTLIVNGQAVRITFDRGFAKVTREWRTGDVVHVYLPMPEHRVLPADSRCSAVQRGPIISCRG